MNINPKIFTASGEELTSYTLFHDMIKVMKATDGVEPAGACCGKNIKQIVNSFLNNKQKYENFMENINTRLIKPLRKGMVYINPIKKMLNYELMTDNEILLCVKNGYLPDDAFDWTKFNNVQKSVEETPIVETVEVGIPVVETPVVETPAAESVEVEIPVAESPAEEETPIVETVEVETPVETPVEKPKRSSKKGSK